MIKNLTLAYVGLNDLAGYEAEMLESLRGLGLKPRKGIIVDGSIRDAWQEALSGIQTSFVLLLDPDDVLVPAGVLQALTELVRGDESLDAMFLLSVDFERGKRPDLQREDLDYSRCNFEGKALLARTELLEPYLVYLNKKEFEDPSRVLRYLVQANHHTSHTPSISLLRRKHSGKVDYKLTPETEQILLADGILIRRDI